MKIELAHDFIAKKIYEEASIEDKSRAKATKYLLERYQHYCSSKDLLLTNGDLHYIARYVDTMDLSEAQLKYIKDSKKAIRNQKMMARFKDAALVGSICAVLFSSWGFWERQRYTNTSTELANAKDSIIHLRNMVNTDHSNKDLPIYDGPKSLEIDDNKAHFSVVKVKGTIKNESGELLPLAKIDVMGAETKSKSDGSFELHLLLPLKDLNKAIELRISKTNYLSAIKSVDTDQQELTLDVVLKRG